MTQMTPPRRGRPKGTGIDDRPRLREIAALIASQPEIRPTTAIKLLGENDPSVIRRLRDKFHAVQAELMADVRKAAAEHQATRSTTAHQLANYPMPERPSEPVRSNLTPSAPIDNPLHMNEGRERAEAASARIAALGRHMRPDPSILEQFAAASVAPATDARTELPGTKTSPGPYDAIIGLTIEAGVAAIEQQMRIYEQIFRLPTMSLFLRNHIAVSQALMNIACSAMRASRSLSAAA